jgi:2-polyprenyl-3-methyl-5-hydroxy-6-metoxy-1,4-benzoquinol methylase
MSVEEYRYDSASPGHAARYLLPTVLRILPDSGTVFELGCGNGANAHELAQRGYPVMAVDASTSGIEIAKKAYKDCRFAVGSAYDDLAGQYGRFDIVVSLEVVEHIYSPRLFAAAIRDLLKAGGVAVISTPYHGYLKNLALAASGRMDEHFTALWDHGHIKFWSRRTLSALFQEVGLREIAFHRVGRIPTLAKSMVAAFTH